jgi:hypothetical protein
MLHQEQAIRSNQQRLHRQQLHGQDRLEIHQDDMQAHALRSL